MKDKNMNVTDIDDVIYIYETGSEPEDLKKLLEGTKLVYERKSDKTVPNINSEYVYCISTWDRIDKYKITELFDIDEIRFSDGYGHSWNYADENKTWSKNPIVLYEKMYDDKRVNSNRYEMIDEIVKSHLDQKTKETAIKALLFGFKGTMYGEKRKKDSEMIDLDIKRVELSYENQEPTGFIYIWGWPGSDCNFYYFKDLNKTWFLK